MSPHARTRVNGRSDVHITCNSILDSCIREKYKHRFSPWTFFKSLSRKAQQNNQPNAEAKHAESWLCPFCARDEQPLGMTIFSPSTLLHYRLFLLLQIFFDVFNCRTFVYNFEKPSTKIYHIYSIYLFCPTWACFIFDWFSICANLTSGWSPSVSSLLQDMDQPCI